MKNRNLFKNATSANLSAVVFACTCEQVYRDIQRQARLFGSYAMVIENLLPFQTQNIYREVAEKIDEE